MTLRIELLGGRGEKGLFSMMSVKGHTQLAAFLLGRRLGGEGKGKGEGRVKSF